MATEVASGVLADSRMLFDQIRKRPHRYTELKAMVENDRERVLSALDRLDGLGVIRRRIIKGDTHFEMIPTVSRV